ncbi:MAG: hypothetical protein JOZ51_25785 [Chloroflexi bacterium]|nr:hypothetical protein [Chloroflexota bacterium]
MPGVINDPAVAMYVATAVALVVMIGFLIYLWRMDRHVRELRRLVEGQSARAAGSSQTAREAAEPLKPQRIDKELSNGLDRR